MSIGQFEDLDAIKPIKHPILRLSAPAIVFLEFVISCLGVTANSTEGLAAT